MNIAASIRAAKLAGSKRLDLRGGLREFPAEIYELAETLEILDLSGNQLSSLPDDFSRLHKLRILFCSDNLFTSLPEVLGSCPALSMVGFKANRIQQVPAAALGKNLRWLILTDNRIDALPAAIGSCVQLQKLMLSGNRLTSLPSELAACTRLELLRIAANRLASLPDCLFQLPRLSWLAYAGNPCCEHSESQALTQHPIAEIDWPDLELQHKLGEGASGVIHQAGWQRAGVAPQTVAVKMFKGSMTSDGLPHSEKTACISAGRQRNLIPLHGKIANHPQGVSGLVMALVDPAMRNLAAPPSLDSCTRDVYPAGLRLSPGSTMQMALAMAATALHLHDKGIMHGDLYAHNILHDGAGNCLLGDFGAASFYAPGQPHLATALQRIEVRAFGCLLEELLERTDAQCNAAANMRQLEMLKQRCLQEDPALRPLFSEIVSALAPMQAHGDGRD